jgi:hypothetical protein
VAWAVVAFALLLARNPFAAPALPHLHGVDEIRDWFNANTGHVRLVLLLSPT